MTNTPDGPTMGEIMKGISDGEIRNCLDEIERSAYMIRKIILIDGQQLTRLMIEHDVGVSVEKTYVIKRIDSDYFDVD